MGHLLDALSRRFAAVLLFSMVALAGGAQTFMQPTVLPTGGWPVAVYTADVNGDGFPDLIYIDQGATATASTTHVLLNDGKGDFTQSAVIATAGSSIAVGDFLGQGHVDIAWAAPSTHFAGNNILLSIAGGTGSGTFPTVYLYSVNEPSPAKPIALGHLASAANQTHTPFPGQRTILVEDTNNNLLFELLSQGVTLTPSGQNIPISGSSALPDGPGPIAVADLNGDGLEDVIVTSGTARSAQIFLTSSGGPFYNGFHAATRFAGTSGVQSLLAQDVNGDGISDLIIEGINGRVDVFPGNGDGTFSQQSIGGTGTLDGTTGNGGHLIAIADFNHDGLLDAITATPVGVSTLLGNGTAYFGLKGIYNAGPGRAAYAVADFNGDGNLDFAVDSPEGIAIVNGNADGSFQTSQAFAAGKPALSGVLGAFHTGGALDAVVGVGAMQAQMLRGEGDGTFAYVGSPGTPVPTSTQSGAAGLVGTVQAGDLNGDGKLDLVITADGGNAQLPASGSGLVVQLGDGAGGFGPVTTVNAAAQFTFPNPASCTPPFDHYPGMLFGTSVVADFNGDGLADIANRDAGAYRILRGNNGSAANSSTTTPTLYWSGVDGSGSLVDCDLHAHDLVVAGDLNNDGRPDLVFQGSGASSGALLVYLTGATGQIAPAGDLSVDGSLTTPGSLVAPALSVTFGGTSPTLGFPAFPGSAVVADLDGDGKNDLVVTYANLAANPAAPEAAAPNFLYVWFGSGGGKFLTSARHPVNPVRIQLSRNFYQVAVADLNGDGIPDLILSDGYVLSYQLGVGDGTFGAEHHLLAGQGLNTISAGDVRNAGHTDLVIANGGVAFGNPVANRDTLAVNPDVQTGGLTVLLNGVTAKTTLAGVVTASPEPSVYFSPSTVTLTLTGSPTPTGTVTFTEGGTPLGTATLVNGVATVAGSATVLPGMQTLTASYSGDGNNAAATFTGTHTVLRAPTVTTLIPTTPLTIFYGQIVDGTYGVSVVDGNHPATGLITVEDNGVSVAGCTAVAYGSSCPYGDPQILDAGIHSLTISYLGDSVNAPSTSVPVLFTVLPDTTTIQLASSVNPAVFGTAVTFTATLTGNVDVPTGAVTFFDGTAAIASGTLVNGVAAFTTSALSVGTHPVTAMYAGTIDFNPATSSVLSQVIVPAPNTLASAITLTSSINPSAPGQLVTFTATVTVQSPFAVSVPGNVTFLDGTVVLGSSALNSVNQASFSTTALAAGSHAITAAYAGAPGAGTTLPPPGPPKPVSPRALPAATSTSGAAILPGVSAVLTQIVAYPLSEQPAGFGLTVSPNPVTIGVGRTAVLLVTVRVVSGFSQPVQLSCSGLPTEAACMFVQSVIPGGGGSTTLDVTTSAPRDCGSNNPYFLGSVNGFLLPRAVPFAAPLLLSLLLWMPRRRRKRVRGLLLLAVCALGLATLSGCGHCTDLGTRPGTYTFTVTGTPQGTPVKQAQSVQVQMTVTIP